MEKLTELKRHYLPHFDQNKVSNRALPSLHGGSLEITLTVPHCDLKVSRSQAKIDESFANYF